MSMAGQAPEELILVLGAERLEAILESLMDAVEYLVWVICREIAEVSSALGVMLTMKIGSDIGVRRIRDLYKEFMLSSRMWRVW